MPNLRAFQAAIERELLPIERAAVADGIDGQRRHTVYLRWNVAGRNDRWEADHVELPILVLPPRGSHPRKPWVTLCIDAYSRLLMGWSLSLVPNAATVLTTLRMAMLIDPARGDYGGLPRAVRPDRGLEFVAEALAQVCAVLGVQLLPAPAYSPHLKGKVERLGRTLAQGRTVQKDGIHLGGVPFIAVELNGRVGEVVEVRAMPHDLRRIEVFVEGRWLATTYPQATLSAEQREQVLRRRQADAAELARRQRRASRLARVRLAPLAGPGPTEETTVIAAGAGRTELQRGHDDVWRRLARTDLLGLERRR